jgi:hypothetical protein
VGVLFDFKTSVLSHLCKVLILTPTFFAQEGEYDGALYREYDGTMCVDQRLADKYIEKNYSKEIKAIKSEIEKLNKKLGAKSPIQFEIVYGVSVGDKTSNIYSGITLKQLPQEIDAKYLKKMENLFK